MRFPLTAVLVTLTACAHSPTPARPPLTPSRLGAAEQFGTGPVALDRERLTLDLTSPAHVGLIRVFPGTAAELLRPPVDVWDTRRYDPMIARELPPGRNTIPLAIARTEPWRTAASLQRLHLGNYETEDLLDASCVFQRLRQEQPRAAPDTLNPASTPRERHEPCMRSRRPPPPELDQPDGRWIAGAPVPLPEHFLVVIATGQSFELAAIARALEELDISLVEGRVAAEFVPRYLFQDRGMRWAAWVVHQPE